MRIWWVVALGACTNEPAHVVVDAPSAHVALVPGACSGAETSLYGMGTSEATRVQVAAMPSTLCLALDGRDNIRIAHFAAGTPYEQASASSFAMALFTVDDQLMREGWDVAFGNGNVFTNLEYGMPVGTVTHVKLVVDLHCASLRDAARSGEARPCGARATEVALHLFEPYE
jgi:hypothetical protein